MGYPEITFVLIILLAAIYLTLGVRREVLDRERRQRDEQRRIEGELRRRNAARVNPRSVTRR